MKIHPDFSDFIAALNNNNVEYVVVGAFDLAYLGYPRYTGDLDIWINPTEKNAHSLLKAISEFGLKSLPLTVQDILSGDVIQLGYPPVRIDLLTILDALTAKEILETSVQGPLGTHKVNYMAKEAFIKNKKAIGRFKDLADIEAIEKNT